MMTNSDKLNIFLPHNNNKIKKICVKIICFDNRKYKYVPTTCSKDPTYT